MHNFSSVSEDEITERPFSSEEKTAIRKKLGISSTRQIVLGVGRFLPLKRFEDLIRAVRDCHSDCDLYILGGQPGAEYLEAADGAENIHFIDFVLPDDVKYYYQAADLFVLPSETDVWGLVLNEAMAQGIPVIASDSVMGAYSLIDGNGCMFETYDTEKLAKDIDLCLETAMNKQMSQRSLEIIRDFTIENMVRKQLPAIKDYFAHL